MGEKERTWLDLIPELPGRISKSVAALLALVSGLVGLVRLLSTHDSLVGFILVALALIGGFLASAARRG